MIEVKELTKKYGSKLALDSVSFTVEDGQVLGLLGPNGAGKSTTMNIMTGNLSATSGSVTIGGYDILEEPVKAKKQLGYLPELPPLYPDMTVDEYLRFVYGLKKCRLPKKEHLDEVCEAAEITDVRRRVIKNLSKGYRQRIGVAQALVGTPDVLILDEPTVGLDPRQMLEIRSLIRSLGKKHTVILSSHILSEVQAVCDRVVVIHRGKLIADDTPENLSRKLGGNHLRMTVEGGEEEVRSVLSGVKGVRALEFLPCRENGCVTLEAEAEEGADLRRTLSGCAAEQGWPLLELTASELSLEHIFLQLTGGTGEPEGSGSAGPDSGLPAATGIGEGGRV